jgi:hypothetical protein
MKRWLGALIVAVLFGSAARADESEAKAIVDKGIKALGGEEKLNKVSAYTVKAKGTMHFGDNENDVTTEVTYQGTDHVHREISTDQFQGVVVLNGDKGWRRFGDNGTMELDDAAIEREKRNAYLQVIPVKLVLVKGKDYKLDTAGEEKVDDKPAVGVKITTPDGKDFTLYFDKESGLPVKEVAKVMSFNGEQEHLQVVTFSDYKEDGGIKHATKSKATRDDRPFNEMEVTEFKILDKVAPDAFSEPK